MMRADLRRIVLFGAIGRHNFGDLLMAEVHAALLNNTGLLLLRRKARLGIILLKPRSVCRL